MIKLSNKFNEMQNLRSKILLQIHDELIFEVDKEEANKYSKIIKEEMMSVKDNNMHLFGSTATYHCEILFVAGHR